MESEKARLASPERKTRAEALRRLAELSPRPVCGNDVNNHIHTRYSFSPYYPAEAVWRAYTAGLSTAGIMDHDSISGAEEFMEAASAVGIAATSGCELRVSMRSSPFAAERINNPDQAGIAYVTLHALPACSREGLRPLLSRVSRARERRNRLMLENINAAAGTRLVYEKDVLPLSLAREGGSVTERHLLFALAGALEAEHGRGKGLIGFLEKELGLALSEKNREWLSDTGAPGYLYDLLGALKGGLVRKIYVDAGDECPDVSELLELAHRLGAVAAYAYLGDVTSSVTGDKAAQRFEDGYLDRLVPYLRELGFDAITYMPSRNTPAQLARLRSLCGRYGLFQISGEDINSPRQSFVCAAARSEEFSNLTDAAYALIGSERLAARDPSKAMFAAPGALEEKIIYYSEIGRRPI